MSARLFLYFIHSKRILSILALVLFFIASTPCRATNGNPTLKYAPAITQVPLVQGGSATDLFTFTTGGSFTGNVTPTISGLPKGVSASWTQNPVAVSGGTGTSTLKLVASKAVPATGFTLTVTAAGSGLKVSKNLTVIIATPPGVQAKDWISSLTMQSMGGASFSVEASPVGGVTVPAGAAGAVAQIVSGLPTGFSASWSTPTVTSSGAVMWLLTLTGSNKAVAGSSSLQVQVSVADAVTGTVYSSGLAVPVSIVLTPATLNFSPALTHLPVKQGSAASDLYSFTGGGSFNGNVTVAVTGLPAGVTASWSQSQISLASGKGSSMLTLSASSAAVVNWFHYTVTASGDGVSVSNTYGVEVEPLLGLQVQLSSTGLTVNPQSTSSLTITATPMNGVIIPAGAAGASAAVVSTLPSGITSSLSQPTLTSSGAASWTLTLTGGNNLQQGNQPVSVVVNVVDATSGTGYTVNQSFGLLVSLLANVTVGSTPGIKIPATFMGLAHEWGMAQTMMGSTATGVNTTYRQLLNNLTAYGSGPINLRIGGNSTDSTGEPTSTTTAPFAQLAEALGVTFELGVNLGSNNVSLATDQAAAYVSQMPAGSINAIEIGNEPDWYPQNGLRPPTYSVQDYYADFYTWKQSIKPVLPAGTKMTGPSWAVTSMLPNLPTFEAQYANDLTISSQHFYVTSPSSTLTPDVLLAPKSATAGPTQVAPAVEATHAQGLPFRIDELNSVSVGGQPGISDTFGAALWSIDTMFEYVNVGVDGVNWQTPGGCYSAFTFYENKLGNGTATYRLAPMNPLYYGLLMFQAATGNGSEMLPVTLSTQANLKAWANTDSSGNVKLVLINKDEQLSGTVALSVPGYSQASIVFLTAPSYTSTTGVSFGGQTFDGSTDGTLQGSRTVQTLDGEDGVFQLPMSITSAALVTFTR